MTDKRHTISVKPHTGTSAGQAFVAWCEGYGSPAPKYYGATEAEAIAKVERSLGQARMTDRNAPERIVTNKSGGMIITPPAIPLHETDIEWARADLLTAAQARIEALERILGLADDQRREWEVHCKAAEVEVERLRDALRLIAHNTSLDDCQTIARAALREGGE